jgi:hypothetical protein
MNNQLPQGPGYYFMGNPQNPQPIGMFDNEQNTVGLIIQPGYTESLEEWLPWPNNLSDIIIADNRITSIPPIKNTSLEWLNCNENQLEELPELPRSLEYLFCGSNFIRELPEPLPPNIISIYAWSNNLEKLPDILPDSLNDFNCGNNRLTKLPDDLSNTNLDDFQFDNNFIEKIPKLPNSLDRLIFNNNRIQKIIELPPNLTVLNCSNNWITELPKILPKKLQKLECANNRLEILPDLPNSLMELKCRGNKFNYDTVEKVIKFYKKAIAENYQNTRPTFQEELEYFNNLKDKITQQSASISYVLENQDNTFDLNIKSKILGFAGLRTPGDKRIGGKKYKTKNRKIKKTKTRKNKRRLK